MRKVLFAISILTVYSLSSFKNTPATTEMADSTQTAGYIAVDSAKLDVYAEFTLTSDLSRLSEKEKEILKILFQVADIMDDLYWKQSYGDKETFLNQIQDSTTRLFAEINYGPWDRLDDNKPFLQGFEAKPAGAGFYPQDMSEQEFEALADSNKTNLYTLIQRDENHALKVVWYHEAYQSELRKAADLLKQAAALAENAELKNYLNLRAEALVTDQYQPSDLAWMDMKNSTIDFVVGPIENYEDQRYGYKTAYESFILIKDVEWSEKLKRFAKFLPKFQKELPVEAIYKKETPGSEVDLNAYDVVYYAGDCNSGSKTIAINLPNDEEVQLKKGSRKLQLKNAMRAKFDQILVPISNILIAEDQRKHIQFEAFFANTMFHEVAHGMGIKNTIDGKSSCRVALKEQYSAIEEGKADILGLYLVTKLSKMGEFGKQDLMDNYVTFMAGIFRSIRFGAASAHGQANLIRFNYFLERKAFTRNNDGTYRINFEKMQEASTALTQEILKLQGDGNYEVAKAFVDKWAVVSPVLEQDLARLTNADIPKDIYYKQGAKVLGL
jgi:hypothetical protein